MKKALFSYMLVLCLLLSMGLSAGAASSPSVFDTNNGTINSGEEYDLNTATDVTNYGVIDTNSGNIAYNTGVIHDNEAVVKTNFDNGTVHNFKGGIVSENHSFVYNNEGCTVSKNYGIVYNLGGNVIENKGGKVYNCGGAVWKNFNGTVYEYHPLSIAGRVNAALDMWEIAESGVPPVFIWDSENLRHWLNTTDGGLCLRPESGYMLEISGDCSHSRQSDGSYVIKDVTGPVHVEIVPIPVSSVPNTADMSNMPLWCTLFIAFAALALMTRKKKA